MKVTLHLHQFREVRCRSNKGPFDQSENGRTCKKETKGKLFASLISMKIAESTKKLTLAYNPYNYGYIAFTFMLKPQKNKINYFSCESNQLIVPMIFTSHLLFPTSLPIAYYYPCVYIPKRE